MDRPSAAGRQARRLPAPGADHLVASRAEGLRQPAADEPSGPDDHHDHGP